MLRGLLVALVVVGLSAPTAWAAAPDGQEDICNTAAVIFCDNFEARAVGAGDLQRSTFKNTGWPVSDSTNITVIADAANIFNGQRALQLRYPAGGGGIGFMNPALPGAYRTVYMRWYTKWSSSYQFSPIATKHVMALTANGSSEYIFWASGSPTGLPAPISTMPLVTFAQFSPASVTYEANMNGDFMPVANRWYCLEMRITQNTTANGADGYLQGWVDGVQRWDYPNQLLDNRMPNQITSFDVSGYWNCLGPTFSCNQPADQHPLMFRWHDNFVVSTQRIGCVSTVTTRPSTPPGLTLR
jgi:hypothetical protein